MAPLARSALFLSALLCASCDRPAIDPSQSLVGAKSLPSAIELSRESVQITPRAPDSIDASRLYYELKPDDSLVLTLTRPGRTHSADETVDAKEFFRLDSTVASTIHRLLWRLRPEQLKGVEFETYPIGCPRQPTDTFPDYSVAFIAEGPEAGVADDRVGIFALPAIQFCHTKSALEARSILQQVLESLPKSKAAAEFERRNAPRDQIIVPL